MRRLLWVLPVTVAVVSTFAASRALAWPDDDFGHMVLPSRTSGGSGGTQPGGTLPGGTLPGGTAPARAQGLPMGMVPDSPSGGSRGPGAAAPNPYPLPANVNPWMICAATYVGADGLELARQLTLVLRNKHRLTAYIYNRGDEDRRAQIKDWEEKKKKYPNAHIPFQRYRVSDQYAVLVDGFKDMASATSYLPKIKGLPMPELKLASGLPAYDTMEIVEPDHEKKKMVSRRANMNPFHNAMVVRSTALASSQSNRPKFDPFWKELNAGEAHNLLENPKKYSLFVKEYTGVSLIQSQSGINSFLNTVGLGSKGGEALAAAGVSPREIVRVLRSPQIGVESYVFHTRKSSQVYVGGFDGPDDPELPRMQRRLAALKFTTKEGGADPIGLMANPPLIEIPRE